MTDQLARPAAHSPPSAYSATALARGEPGALIDCTLHTAFRACLVSVGMYAAGVPQRELLRAALSGAMAIEVFLVAYAAHMEARATRRPG
jgi:hypothetical protein